MRRLAYIANVTVSLILGIGALLALVSFTSQVYRHFPFPYNFALIYLVWFLVALALTAMKEGLWKAFFAITSLKRVVRLMGVVILIHIALLIINHWFVVLRPALDFWLFMTLYLIMTQDHPFPFFRWGRVEDLPALIKTGDVLRLERMITSHPEQVNTHTRSGDTPLLLALASNAPQEVAKLLLEAGAGPDMPNYRGVSPLFIAIFRSSIIKDDKLVELLLQHGADPNVPIKGETTPLHMAAIERNAEITRLLLEYGADANTINYRGETPLHFAARNGNVVVVKMLLEHGADVNAQTAAGATPVKLAEQPGVMHWLFARKGRRRVVELLRQQASMG